MVRRRTKTPPTCSEQHPTGICILLAIQAYYFLRRRGSSGCGVLICAMILFCGLAIAQMIHQVVVTAMLLRLHHSAWTIETVSERQRLQATFQRLSEVKEHLFVYRCCVIWGDSEARYKRWVIFLSLLLVLFTTILGIVTVLLSWNPTASFIVVELGMIAANLFLTGLTAGRIWRTRRRLRIIDKTELIHRHNTAITLLLESSALYFALMFTFFVIEMCGGPQAALLESPAISVFTGASAQFMNILPALLIVRVCLARSIDVDPTAGDLKLEPSPDFSAC
ncbi:hypothetical protein K438DRAFT_829830 [Mycena galopus ATCC 62051]|nr:hypothetical protein K438DRAFT_829830 [Mycena galopus ATCC 62051]